MDKQRKFGCVSDSIFVCHLGAKGKADYYWRVWVILRLLNFWLWTLLRKNGVRLKAQFELTIEESSLIVRSQQRSPNLTMIKRYKCLHLSPTPSITRLTSLIWSFLTVIFTCRSLNGNLKLWGFFSIQGTTVQHKLQTMRDIKCYLVTKS